MYSALKYSRLKGKLPEILAKDTASTIEVSSRVIVSWRKHSIVASAEVQALGTHNGMVHILTYEGSKVNSSRPHGASITCLRLDEENDFVATSSVEGQLQTTNPL
jgi:malate synthase